MFTCQRAGSDTLPIEGKWCPTSLAAKNVVEQAFPWVNFAQKIRLASKV